MASSHGDHTVRVVDCKTFKCVKTLKGHPRTPWCITFHPSSDQLLASGCLGGQVRVWNLQVSFVSANGRRGGLMVCALVSGSMVFTGGLNFLNLTSL